MVGFDKDFPPECIPSNESTSDKTEEAVWPAIITVCRWGTTWEPLPTAGALRRTTGARKHFCSRAAGGRGRGEPHTMYPKQQNQKSVYRVYLASLGKKMKYYKPSIEVAPCCHTIQKHFKPCCQRLPVSISQRVWNSIYVHEREWEQPPTLYSSH